MIRTSRGARPGRLLLATAAAGGALLASAGFLTTSADAAFTTGKCQGDAIIGRGASFAASAYQQVFIPQGFPPFCADVGTTPSATYESTGSGSGRRVVGARTNGSPEGDNTAGNLSRSFTPRFGMSDEPPSATDQSNINKGTDAVGDEGVIRTIPVALGAVAVAVNVPDGCTAWTKPGTTTAFSIGSGDTGFTVGEQARISDFGNVDKARVQLTRSELDLIFNGDTDYDTWGKLVPWINDGDGTASEASDTRCGSFPLTRVRRLDDGGTTFAFKDYLGQLNPSRGWLTTYIAPDTRTWPNASRFVAFDYNNDGDTLDRVTKCGAQYAPFVTDYPAVPGGDPTDDLAGAYCDESKVPLLQTTPVTAPAGNGNDDLINQVADFDGSIGYGDLSTARQQRSFAFERQAGATDDKFWVKLQSKNLAGYADPQSAPTGFQTSGARGSNCASSVLRNLPAGDDPTLANWFNVSATDSSQAGYGICTLTYALAFDDYAKPYAAQVDQAAEERKARTVRDMLESAVTTGQLGLQSFDYSPLSPTIQALALAAVQHISWAKTAGGGGGGGGGGTPPPAAAPTSTPTPIATATVSNAFTLSKPRSSGSGLVVTAQVPNGGNVRVLAKAKIGKRTVTVATGASSRTAGGTVRITLKLSAAARRALARKSLKVSLQITFSPTGGEPKTTRATLTLKRQKARK